MPVIDEDLLDERLAVLERARDWSPRTVAKLEALIHAPDDVTLVRVNPFAFARERNLAAAEALDLFLHAVRAGLFTMDWHLLCPACGAAVESFASLRRLHRTFFCSLCAIHTEANLDDYIQVSFTVTPAVRRLRFHDIESLTAEEFFYKVRFTGEAHLGSVDGPRVVELIQRGVSVLSWVEPGQRLAFAVDMVDGEFSAAEFHAHSGVQGKVVTGDAGTRLDMVIDETALTCSTEQVRAGRIEGSVENRRGRKVVFALANKPAAVLGQQHPGTVFEPMVTGGMLLTNQTFRRLFRNETVGGVDGIGVRDVTVLFTDLKSSTALYERIGDLRAFSLVQQHFDRLSTVVQDHAGAIVKTIGDAVMAAFQRPADAVGAALDMQAQIERFNRERGADEVILKIGIHRGPSIAVTLNDALDYFGHTVNVASRVQGLADADEICVTDDVLRGDGVVGLIRPLESFDAQLRGISKEVRVHKVAAGS